MYSSPFRWTGSFGLGHQEEPVLLAPEWFFLFHLCDKFHIQHRLERENEREEQEMRKRVRRREKWKEVFVFSFSSLSLFLFFFSSLSLFFFFSLSLTSLFSSFSLILFFSSRFLSLLFVSLFSASFLSLSSFCDCGEVHPPFVSESRLQSLTLKSQLFVLTRSQTTHP